jgi:cobalt/nickel transport system ATP-binding protein
VNAVSLCDLHFSYPDRPGVLTGVSLDVEKGEKLGLIGPNGSGKTTLFLLIAGVLKPSAGSVEVMGETVTHGWHNRDFGLVFQNPDDQLFSITVRDDLAFGLRNMGKGREETERLVDSMLDDLGMPDLADRPPHHLSGGEKRMISLAGVMIMNPGVVALDEPDAGLDSRSRRKLIDYITASDRTMLIASHDLEFLLETCPRTVVLDEGNIHADGPSELVMSDSTLMMRHGLEKPHSLVPHAEPHHRR